MENTDLYHTTLTPTRTPPSTRPDPENWEATEAKPIKRWMLILIFFTIVAFVFTTPLFQHIDHWGIQDWDQHLFYHAVPRATIVEYGQIPLWNPYYVGGTVLLANPQSRVLSPSFLLVLALGEVAGVKIEMWLHLVIGLLGTYVLARHFRLGAPAAILAAFVFMLNSMYFLNFQVGMTWILSIAYLPWVFWSFLKAWDNWRYGVACGLFLALMFFGGGAYPLPITILFLSFYALTLIVLKQQKLSKAIIVLSVTLAFMVCLGAVKFFPAVEFLQQHPRHIYDYSGFSLNSLYFSLFHRDQTLNAIVELPISEAGFLNGVTGGMDENGMYIGLMPFVLFIIGISLRDKRRLILIICILFFLWLSLGSRPRLELWSWLHLLPVYNSMRIAQRFRIIFMVCLVILAGFGLQTIQLHLERMISRQSLARLLTWGIVLLVGVDLYVVNGRLLEDAFPIHPLETVRSDRFYQVWELPSYDQNGWIAPEDGDASDPFAEFNPHSMYSSYGSMYPAFLANVGTINGYETAYVPRNAVPSDSQAYQGEVYLSGTSGTATVTFWSPNRLVIAVRASGEGRLVINQNYYSGWRVRGAEERVVENVNGLLGVKVAPGDRQIELQYLPISFVVGLVVTGVTVMLLIAAGAWRYGFRPPARPISWGVTGLERS